MYRLKLRDGVVWVTGASTGIGYAIVVELAKAGYTIAITARNTEALDKLTSMYPSRIFSFPGDVTNREQMIKIVYQIEKQFGSITLALLNAGGFHSSEGILGEGFRKTMDLNFNGTLNCLEPVVESMSKRGFGQIAVMSSVSGYVALPFFGDGYVVSKSALITLCEVLKPKLEARNIRLQVVAPSFIKTTLISHNMFNMPFLVSIPEAAKKIVKGIQTGGFEICFPKITAYWLKFIGLMPYVLYFPLTKITMFFIRK